MKILILSALIFCSAICVAQKKTYTSEQVAADLGYLYAQLKKYHPDLYIYTSKEAFDSWVKIKIQQLPDLMNDQEAYQQLASISQPLKDGHTLFFPDQTVMNEHYAKSPYFPFKTYWDGDKLFIESNYSSNRYLYAGTEILDINNTSADKVVANCLDNMMRDGYNMNYPVWVLNNYFADYYSYIYGFTETFHLICKDTGNVIFHTDIEGLTKAQISAYRNERYPQKIFARGINNRMNEGITLSFDVSKRTALLTVRDFDNGILKRNYGQRFKKTIREYFSHIKQFNPQNLVVDLRDNQGGNITNGSFLLSFLLKDQFKVVEEYYEVAKAEEDLEVNRNKPVSGQSMGTFRPRKKAFKGDIFLLINGGSFSNSGIVSSVFQLHKRGLIIGEETGGNKSLICGNETMTILPNTKLTVYIPTRQFVIRKKSENNGHGVIPDMLVKPDVIKLAKGEDAVLDIVHQLIYSIKR